MKDISKIRSKIDKIDQKILILLKERVELAGEIGKVKRQSGIAVKDEKREEELMQKVKEQALKLNLNGSIVKRIWNNLIKLSYKAEE